MPLVLPNVLFYILGYVGAWLICNAHLLVERQKFRLMYPIYDYDEISVTVFRYTVAQKHSN